MFRTSGRRMWLKRRQRGMIMGYFMAALTVMTLVVYAVHSMGRDAKQSQWMQEARETVFNQQRFISQKILLCALYHPSGDNGTGFHVKYPGGSGVAVSTLECPGDPSANKNLWSGVDGAFLPPPPPGFNAWTYTNDATSVRIVISSSGGSAEGAVLARVAEKIGAEASTAGSPVSTLTIVVAQ